MPITPIAWSALLRVAIWPAFNWMLSLPSGVLISSRPWNSEMALALFLHGDVELRALDHRHEERSLDAQRADFAMSDVVEHVATALHESRDQLTIGRFRRDLDVAVGRNRDVRAGLREAQHAVVAGDDPCGQADSRIDLHRCRGAGHRHRDGSADGRNEDSFGLSRAARRAGERRARADREYQRDDARCCADARRGLLFCARAWLTSMSSVRDILVSTLPRRCEHYHGRDNRHFA